MPHPPWSTLTDEQKKAYYDLAHERIRGVVQELCDPDGPHGCPALVMVAALADAMSIVGVAYLNAIEFALPNPSALDALNKVHGATAPLVSSIQAVEGDWMAAWNIIMLRLQEARRTGPGKAM